MRRVDTRSKDFNIGLHRLKRQNPALSALNTEFNRWNVSTSQSQESISQILSVLQGSFCIDHLSGYFILVNFIYDLSLISAGTGSWFNLMKNYLHFFLFAIASRKSRYRLNYTCDSLTNSIHLLAFLQDIETEKKKKVYIASTRNIMFYTKQNAADILRLLGDKSIWIINQICLAPKKKLIPRQTNQPVYSWLKVFLMILFLTGNFDLLQCW